MRATVGGDDDFLVIRDPEASQREPWAMLAVRLGLGVFPLRPVFHRDGCPAACGCSNPGCSAVGKHPAITNWSERCARDERSAWLLLSSHPRAGLGVVTGSASGVVVIETDPRHGGDKSWAALEERRGKLPATLTVLSGRGDGGRHRYFRIPPDKIIRQDIGRKLGAGIDVKGERCMVVWPPSQHRTGGCYDLDRGQPLSIATLPADLVELLKAPAGDDRPRVAEAAIHSGRPRTYANRALRSAADQLAVVAAGFRNDRTNQAAFACGQLVGLGLLDGEDAAYELTAAAVRCGLPGREAYRTALSGLIAGARLVDPDRANDSEDRLRRVEWDR